MYCRDKTINSDLLLTYKENLPTRKQDSKYKGLSLLFGFKITVITGRVHASGQSYGKCVTVVTLKACFTHNCDMDLIKNALPTIDYLNFYNYW